MSNENIPPVAIPDHLEETIRSISQLRTRHHESASPVQRMLDRITALLSRPRFIGMITAFFVGWMGLNLLIAGLGGRPFDPPPFAWLQDGVSLAALYMVVLILVTQRREDQLTQRRELLMLELAILSEQKTAKVIRLLEESRRDNPLIPNRRDAEADAMALPADPDSVLEVIRETHEQSTK